MATTAAAAQPGEKTGMSFGRLVVGYGIVTVFLIVAIGISITLGNEREPATAIGANYAAEGSECLAGEFEVAQSGEFVTLDGSGSSDGKLRLKGDQLTGDVTCADGTTVRRDTHGHGRWREHPPRGHDRRRAGHCQPGSRSCRSPARRPSRRRSARARRRSAG